MTSPYVYHPMTAKELGLTVLHESMQTYPNANTKHELSIHANGVGSCSCHGWKLTGRTGWSERMIVRNHQLHTYNRRPVSA